MHPAPAAVIKWVARVRTGYLASRARLANHGLLSSAACPCCGAAEENDIHMMAGCPATGSSDWASSIIDAWQHSAAPLGYDVPLPSMPWLQENFIPLLAALIPLSARTLLPLPPSIVDRFLHRLHHTLSARIAEVLRRREVLIAATSPDAIEGSLSPSPLPTDSSISSSGLSHLCPLLPKR